jgi:glycerate dehydrogenase
METLVTFPVSERHKKIGNSIIGGENIIWFPQTGPAEIFLVKNISFTFDHKPKFIQVIYAGTDHIDMNRIPEGTKIASNAGAYSIPVAEHAFALLLERTKKISKFKFETSMGIFKPEETRLLYGKRLGIIGYGGIGSKIASFAKAFGMDVSAVARGYTDHNADRFYSLENLDKLLTESDIVVISIPLTKRTLNLIGEKELNLLKKDAILINIARSEIIKKDDMINFLKRNTGVSYLSDVWWGEPELKDAGLENIVVTPHVAGGLSDDVMDLVFETAFKNIKRFIDGEPLRNLVNIEESYFVGREK